MSTPQSPRGGSAPEAHAPLSKDQAQTFEQMKAFMREVGASEMTESIARPERPHATISLTNKDDVARRDALLARVRADLAERKVRRGRKIRGR